jgi:hypothetical protein
MILYRNSDLTNFADVVIHFTNFAKQEKGIYLNEILYTPVK